MLYVYYQVRKDDTRKRAYESVDGPVIESMLMHSVGGLQKHSRTTADWRQLVDQEFYGAIASSCSSSSSSSSSCACASSSSSSSSSLSPPVPPSCSSQQTFQEFQASYDTKFERVDKVVRLQKLKAKIKAVSTMQEQGMER